MKEKSTIVSTFFGTSPSDHIPKATKNDNIAYTCLFFTVGIPVNYTSKFYVPGSVHHSTIDTEKSNKM